MPLDRKAVGKGAAAQIQTFEQIRGRALTDTEKQAIRKQHERVATTVERKH